MFVSRVPQTIQKLKTLILSQYKVYDCEVKYRWIDHNNNSLQSQIEINDRSKRSKAFFA